MLRSKSAMVFEMTGCEIDKVSAAFAMLSICATVKSTWRSRSFSLRPMRSVHCVIDL